MNDYIAVVNCGTGKVLALDRTGTVWWNKVSIAKMIYDDFTTTGVVVLHIYNTGYLQVFETPDDAMLYLTQCFRSDLEG